jgi:hypothetical protein
MGTHMLELKPLASHAVAGLIPSFSSKKGGTSCLSLSTPDDIDNRFSEHNG